MQNFMGLYQAFKPIVDSLVILGILWCLLSLNKRISKLEGKTK